MFDQLFSELSFVDIFNFCVFLTFTICYAYQLGYDVVVAKDATDSFTEEDYLYGIKYLKETYGAKVTDVDTLVSEF